MLKKSPSVSKVDTVGLPKLPAVSHASAWMRQGRPHRLQKWQTRQVFETPADVVAVVVHHLFHS